MRETKAKGVALGTGLLILGLVSLFAVLQQEGTAAPGTDASAADEPAEVAAPATEPETANDAGSETAAEVETAAGTEADAVEVADAPADPDTGPQAVGAPESAAQDSVIMAGRAVYEDADCAICHSIAGEGSPRSPLDGVGSRLEADEIRLWIVDPQAAQPGVRKPAFDDLPEEDVDALVAYLQTLTG